MKKKNVEYSWEPFMPYFLFIMIMIGIGMMINQRITDPGGAMSSSDGLNASSYTPFVVDSFEKGEYPEWYPYIFCGMPSLLSVAPFTDPSQIAIHALIRMIEYIVPISILVGLVLLFKKFFGRLLLKLISFILSIKFLKKRQFILFAFPVCVFGTIIFIGFGFTENPLDYIPMKIEAIGLTCMIVGLYLVVPFIIGDEKTFKYFDIVLSFFEEDSWRSVIVMWLILLVLIVMFYFLHGISDARYRVY